MVELHSLKHSYDRSDEKTSARWVETPYWQHFCGFELFQHALPIDPSAMTRCRKRIGPEEMEKVVHAPRRGPRLTSGQRPSGQTGQY